MSAEDKKIRAAGGAENGGTLAEDVRGRLVDIRGQRVLLDFDVAAIYAVETKRVNEAVRNNPAKFPAGYVFELDEAEAKALRSKFSTIETSGRGRHSKYDYKAFTERG